MKSHFNPTEMGIQRMREVALGYEFNHIPKALSRLHTERGQFPDGGYLRPGMATTFRGRTIPLGNRMT